MSIKPLNKETIKLINSGQVISSIYSAVKELVENSLDAEAQNVEVNLVDNGLSVIEVKDNGCGISRDDAQYMALPAYTSKIKDFNDLDLLSTYGFRGEGLTSVCQVSDVTISTKTEEDLTMLRYTLNHDGQVMSSEISHGLNGTTIQMKNLFKNMPVRRNILNNKRRINQELKAIELLLKMYAICKPSVRFMLRVNSKTVFTKFTCKTVLEAVKSVFGIQNFSKLAHLTKNFGQTDLQIFIPKKDVKDISEITEVGLQFICVNDRPIKCKEMEKKINKRISEYFNQTTSNSRKYMFCLILKVDPSMLDVNLEPNKDKVYLHNESAVLDELDKNLLSFYELQDSQISVQQMDIENMNCNTKVNELEKKNQLEIEWTACKKRKSNSNEDNICNINTLNKNIQDVKRLEDDTKKKSDYEFLRSINGPVLSDSDSNDTVDINRRTSKKNDDNLEKMDVSEFNNEEENSELFDIVENNILKDEDKRETFSQLPVVDLGDDFNWQEIINKSNIQSNEEKSIIHQITPEKIATTDIVWSKGQVPGLNGGVTVTGIHNDQNDVSDSRGSKEKKQNLLEDSELFDLCDDVMKIDDSEEFKIDNNVSIPENMDFEWSTNLKNRKRTPTKKIKGKPDGTSKQIKRTLDSYDDLNQTKIPFAGDTAGLINTGVSAFAMYCAEARKRILEDHPDLTPAEVAVQMNRQWKEASSEERQYYRDLANEQNTSLNNSSLPRASKKPKLQLSQAEKEKNKKQLLSMLESMKVNKSEAKKENLIMRTFAVWNISVPMIKENVNQKCQTTTARVQQSVVGSLGSKVWIVNIKSKLFALDVTKLHDGLNIKEYDMSRIDANYIEGLVNKWITQKNNMSLFHPLHTVDK